MATLQASYARSDMPSSRRTTKRATSFDDLPIEIADHVCSLLKQSEASRLSLATKSIYRLVRPILYRHPRITSYRSFARFQRTVTEATYMGKTDQVWSSYDCLDQTKFLYLAPDPTRDSVSSAGHAPSAIMISKMLQAVVRRCPTLDITLCFEHCHCDSAPISSFGNETFPRVRRLILYVGNQDPEETHQRRARCVPNAKFWRPFVNGSSFPDCVDLEVHHYWATKPPDGASLDLGVSDYFVGRGSPGVIGRSEGLERLESIFLEKPPELDSSILMQLLGNPKSMASNLKTLELRFCKLDSQTIAQLLYHAPPNLKRVVLLCQDDRQFTHEHHDDQEQRQHLCPLIREFSKNLNHIEFGAASICRELFFDDLERQELELNDIITTSGSPTESSVSNNSLDGHAIRRAVEDCRQRKRMNHRNDRVKQAIIACQANTITSTNHTSLFGESIKPTAAAFKAQRDTETLLDEEEQTRKRLIEGSTPKWFRRFISWHGLCFPSDTWAEMQLAADLEEEGIEWVLASMFSLDARRTRTVAAPANGAKDKVLQVASHHSNGKPSATLDYERALEEKYRLGV